MKICAKHPELNGTRNKRGRCPSCESINIKNAYIKHREKVRLSGETYYFGSICTLHPEIGGKRRSINGKCIKCHNRIQMKKCQSRRKTSTMHHLKHRIQTRLGTIIRNRGWTKPCATSKMLGCSWEEFEKHIESQFTSGMNWENRDLWEIDHIIPLDVAKRPEDLIPLNHFTNLQPLWAGDNRNKGSKVTCNESLSGVRYNLYKEITPCLTQEI